MNDMIAVIIPKSDQISADDFLAGPRTYLIEEIEIRPGTEQPVSIFLAGEPRAWKPCKSMSRCLVSAWGPDANVYKGRSVTLYRDPKVKWGGMEVGGIRISHMSHIEREMLLQLTATKGKRAPHIVKPLVIEQRDDIQPRQQKAQTAQEWADERLDVIDAATTLEELDGIETAGARAMRKLEGANPDLHGEVTRAYEVRRAALTRTGPDDSQRGDQFTDADDAEDTPHG